MLSCLWSMGFSDISEANRAFLLSDYRGAVERYRTVVEKGEEDADLFYNLATAYLYMGEYGNAILWYRRAELLTGRSEDIERNIRFAVEGLEEQGTVVADDDSLIYNLVRRYYNPYISLVYIVLINLLFFILILRRFSFIRRDVKPVVNILIILNLLLTLYLGLRIYYIHIQERGVIIVKSSDVKEGPSDAYRTISQIGEGTTVRIRERYGDFLLIELQGKNLRGWIPVLSAGLLKVSRL